MARRYDIAPRLLFRWKQELVSSQTRPKTERVFLPLTVSDGPPAAVASSSDPEPPAGPAQGPLIIERSPQEIEVELVGGRRLRFAPDTDPETVRALIGLLEGAGS